MYMNKCGSRKQKPGEVIEGTIYPHCARMYIEPPDRRPVSWPDRAFVPLFPNEIFCAKASH
ncbi:uncharacterized protein ASPGLDRAFT_52994 [Aspergillus glaucus CBS 516.65]|uniref:Uncharacterized protein n=1 Tax=Aspergillus glaucus CBS 516.65 TaxID=1160497 RepID=A0A1L9V5A5_ASPGL|nr:hypothetical protein ASPGLDRAFT_52994 [Aspergillus glaucus CBS 516.65]OJJ79103.1 hypothetical protein ASPGLDRAFT_52994 [Aspergillus glaucus CBS 516.65]